MSNYETSNKVCFECSGKQKKRSCSCQGNVSCLDRIEGDGLRLKGKILPESTPVPCQCIEEEAWNKNIPPKPNCEWLNSFKELRRQWSNHSRQQQNCKCYGCNSYRCQSCLLSSYTGGNVLSPTVRQNDSFKVCPQGSRSKDKSTSTSKCSLSPNYNSPVTNFQNSRNYQSQHGNRSNSPRRSILRKGQCFTPECCFCHTAANACNCASSVRENSERDYYSEYSRERKFPRNNSDSTEKLHEKCQLQDEKYLCYKCEPSSLPSCGQCPATSCCREDSDSSSSRSKSATPSKSSRHKTSDNFFQETHVPKNHLGGHNSSGTLTEVMKDESCCCYNLKISENRREFIKQRCHNSKQNSLLPKNCFQCPMCSSVLSSIVWKCPTIISPKSYKSSKFDVKVENNSKFKVHPQNSNYDLNTSISCTETCKIDVISGQEKYDNEKVKFHKDYNNEEKKFDRKSNYSKKDFKN
ncbi:uncharacterized protein LOC122506049 [Leptopilina heterotoma]|uniref:uncharacterized protein LOC122506049 n=1 Tax=Leptopilina heterotoma TaxID=63436 RepID=UPI001CA88048|nr:uncharacterized protein LOC122506049 [Leptopilina heterotoma]